MSAANDNDNRRRRLASALRGTPYANLPTLKQSAARITAAARDPQNVKKFGRMGAANMAAGQIIWELARKRREQVEAGK